MLLKIGRKEKAATPNAYGMNLRITDMDLVLGPQ
jgi:hypothetical protein